MDISRQKKFERPSQRQGTNSHPGESENGMVTSRRAVKEKDRFEA
jgi:hypothetical protein